MNLQPRIHHAIGSLPITLKADDYEKAAKTITETILRGILRDP